MTNCTLFLLGKSKRQHNIYWIYNTTRTSSINKTESEIMFPRRVVISCTHNETKNESEIVFFGKVKCSVAWPANMIQISLQVNEIMIVISSPITHVISSFLTARWGIIVIEHLDISDFDSKIIHFTWVISL